MQIIQNSAKPDSDQHGAPNTTSTLKNTPVNRMFNDRSVFITGASGFIGRVLLEKLLRTYLGIKTIYILLRPKKDKSPHERLHKQLLRAPIFDTIRAMPDGSKLFDKIKIVEGDLGEPELGIGSEDMQTLLADESLSIIFHSAATIKFDEPLKISVKMNMVATKTLIQLSRRLPNLIGLCHVSTAYVNSDIKDNQLIEERPYPMKDEPEHLIKMTEIMSEDLMQKLKKDMVGERPNTYTYTKALTEHMIMSAASDLPIAIVRPTIVGAAWKEPIPGWIDNLNGPTGLVLAVGKGLCRSLWVDHKAVADIIPVDVTVNTMIAAAFYAAVNCNKLDSNGNLMAHSNTNERNRFNHKNLPDQVKPYANGMVKDEHDNDGIAKKRPPPGKCPPIIHCNSGQVNPILWGQFEPLVYPIIRNYPSCQILRYPFGSLKSNYWHDLVARIFAHYLPALILDLICILTNKQPQLLSIYKKLHAATAALHHFTTQNYNFKTSNIKLLKSSLCESDQQDLYMDIENLDWISYWNDYMLGARRYVLREKDHTLQKARQSLLQAYYIEIFMRTILGALLVALCWLSIGKMTSTHLKTAV